MARKVQEPIISHVRKMLLPLPPPFVRWLEHLLRLLPSWFCPVTLLPVNDIQLISSENGDYLANEIFPCFQVVADHSITVPGWYLLEAALVRHGGNRIARLYVDRGRGFIDDDSIFIPSNRRGSISEVIFLPNGLLNVRWSPMETVGRFTQSALIFHRITRFEATLRRAWRVWGDWWRLRQASPAERQGVNWYSPFVNLSAAYAWSAGLRRAYSSTPDYLSFIQRTDSLSADEVLAISQHILRLQLKPVLSVLMPVFNPPVDFFVSALASVIAQHYPYWELCIAMDASTDDEIRKLIQAHVVKDSRINAVFCSDSAESWLRLFEQRNPIFKWIACHTYTASVSVGSITL